MRFRFVLDPMANPVLTLGGRFTRPRPVIPIGLVGPTGAKAVAAPVEPGADGQGFHDTVARDLGIDLTNAPQGAATGLAMNQSAIRYAEVIVRLAQGAERREWRAWVGFTSDPIIRPVLGFAGFLQFFTATF